MKKIRNKKSFTIKDLEDKKTYTFDDDKIQNFGLKVDFATKKIEYFIEIKGYYPYIISKEDFEQFKKYMEEERDVVWSNDGE